MIDTNYEKAKEPLIPIATEVEKEFQLLNGLGCPLKQCPFMIPVLREKEQGCYLYWKPATLAIIEKEVAEL